MSFEGSLDAYLTNPGSRDQEITVYCHNKDCVDFSEPITVLAHQEYGHTTWHPDGCPSCGQPLEEDEP